MDGVHAREEYIFCNNLASCEHHLILRTDIGLKTQSLDDDDITIELPILQQAFDAVIGGGVKGIQSLQ